MGDYCCCQKNGKEPSESEIQKPEENINTANKNTDNSQKQNELIAVKLTQNSPNLRSSSPEYEQRNTLSMSPQYNRNSQSFEDQNPPHINQTTGVIIPNDESNNIVNESQNKSKH